MRYRQHVNRFINIGLALSLFVTLSLGVMPVQQASAAACNESYAGGGGGGSLLSLLASAEPIESDVQLLTSEFTPKQAWSSESSFSASVRFAKSDCSSVSARVSARVVGTELEVSFYDANRTAEFVSGTDYKSLASGAATVAGASHTDLTITYQVSAISANEAQSLSIDIGTDPGWAEVSIKQGSATSIRIASIKLPADAVSFYSSNGSSLNVSWEDPSFWMGDSCSDISGTGEILVRTLAAGAPVGMAAFSGGTCGYGEASYDVGTKTASLKYNTVGKVVQRMLTGNMSVKSSKNGGWVSAYTSLGTDSYQSEGKTYHHFKNIFQSSVSTKQQLYFSYRSYADNDITPREVLYPFAGGIFDFSKKDVDMSKVSMDLAEYASMAHGLGSVTKNGTFTLFAAQAKGDKAVGVCPGATDIKKVKLTCKDAYLLKEGETKNGATASLVTVGDKKFWRVDGLTGTGIFSSKVATVPGDPNTGAGRLLANPAVAITGATMAAGSVLYLRRRQLS